MKIVIDDKIPFIAGVFEPYAEVVYLDGGKITAKDVQDADVLVIRTRTRCDAVLLEGSRVQMIATATIGFDHIDMAYCTARNIKVVTSAGCNAGGVAQWVMAVVGEVVATPDIVLGIVGLGNVGQRVARIAKQMGIQVIANDPPLSDAGMKGLVDLPELLKQSDIVTVHVPLNRTGKYVTESLVNEEFLSQMKRNAWLLNSSRGEVVDETALLAKLKTDTLYAALDVWRHEPEINRDLLKTVYIATPHVAGYSLQGKANGTAMAVHAVAAYWGWTDLLEWYPEGVEPPMPYEEKQWDLFQSELVRHYPILAETNKLKQFPEQFENFRNEYAYRAEFF